MTSTPDTPNSPQREMTSHEKAEARYFTAASGKPATDEQKATVKSIQERVVALAEEIYEAVPKGVCRSKALTDLNDVAMWAIRGIFDEGRSHIN